MAKHFCLDTNVLVDDPDAIFRFDEHTVVIPFEVLTELDRHKVRQDIVGANTRKVIRSLDELRAKGWLTEGVPLNDVGGTLIVPERVRGAVTNDDAILSVAQSHDATLITNDINMRVLAGAARIEAQHYEWNGKREDALYSGAQRISIGSDLIDTFYDRGHVDLPVELRGDLHPHQFTIAKNGVENHSAIGRYLDGQMHALKVTGETDIAGIRPKNKEQQFALDLLTNPDIPLVSLIGKAGCGKSLLATAAGLHQTVERDGRYTKLIVTRPVTPMGRDLGYLPGTLEEKMSPWIQPIRDSLSMLLGGDKRTIDMKFEDGSIEIEALTYIRGRSIPKAYMIVDECQNLSVPEIKAVVTRIGEGSKIVLTGDIEQIDGSRFDARTNGLAYLIEKFKDQAVAGHITLLKGERSDLATLAADLL